MKILSREALRQFVANEPGKYNAVVIHEVGNYDDVADIVQNCKHALVLEMDDVTSGRPGSPTREHVESAINSGYDLVACRQGVSRSAAIAFLIHCKKTSPQEAAQLWDVRKHFPNELILKHGLDILGDQIKPQVTAFYKALATHRNWKWQPHNLVTKFFKEDS